MMKFGLIGYGLVGPAPRRFHRQGTRKPNWPPSPVATGRRPRPRGKAYPDVPLYTDYRELLAREDIDAVDVVVPNHLHCEVGVAALEAGKHMLLEKPMALSVSTNATRSSRQPSATTAS